MENKKVSAFLMIGLLSLSACQKSEDSKRTEVVPARASSLDASKASQISGDSTTAASADASKAQSTDKSKAKVVVDPDKIKVKPRPKVPNITIPSPSKNPPGNLKQKPQGTQNQSAKDAQFMIRIEDLSVLKAIDVEAGAALMDNGLVGAPRALNTLMDRGFGIYCQSRKAALLKKGDILQLVGAEEKVHEKDKTIGMVSFIYTTKDKRGLVLDCVFRGEAKTSEHIYKNFAHVLTFSDINGKWLNPSTPNPDTEDPKAVNAKRQTFKIKNMEMLEKIHVKDDSGTALTIIDGKLMDAQKTQDLIAVGKAEQSCQIVLVNGALQKDKIYSYADTEIIDANHTSRVAVLAYTYKADEKNNLTFFCMMKMSTLASEIFKTFEGVLEFGAK